MKLSGNVTTEAKIVNNCDTSGDNYGITGNKSQNVLEHIKFKIFRNN